MRERRDSEVRSEKALEAARFEAISDAIERVEIMLKQLHEMKEQCNPNRNEPIRAAKYEP